MIMGYSFIPFLIIILSLAVIIVIVVRKLPQITLLDVANLPEVKEEKRKNEYLKRRVQKRAEASRQAAAALADKLIVSKLIDAQGAFRRLVHRVETEARSRAGKERKKASLESQHEMQAEKRMMLQEAMYAFERGDFDAAETKYIAVIRVDAANPDAYRGLGDVYRAQGHTKEAKETFGFLLRMVPNDEHAIVELANIAEEEGNIEKAVEYYEQAVLLNDHKAPRFMKIAELLRGICQNDTALEAVKQAVELEPQNPKYLDFLAETSILVGDKNLAEEAFQHLRMVNPENQKLDILKDKISQMPR